MIVMPSPNTDVSTTPHSSGLSTGGVDGVGEFEGDAVFETGVCDCVGVVVRVLVLVGEDTDLVIVGVGVTPIVTATSAARIAPRSICYLRRSLPLLRGCEGNGVVIDAIYANCRTLSCRNSAF